MSWYRVIIARLGTAPDHTLPLAELYDLSYSALYELIKRGLVKRNAHRSSKAQSYSLTPLGVDVFENRVAYVHKPEPEHRRNAVGARKRGTYWFAPTWLASLPRPEQIRWSKPDE